MRPEMARMARCRRCRALFWLREPKVGWGAALVAVVLLAAIGWNSYGPWGLVGGIFAAAVFVAPLVRQLVENIPARFAEPLMPIAPADFADALAQGLGDTREHELWLRSHLHWAANDVITRDRTVPGDPAAWNPEARDNAERLVALLKDPLFKAELLRELGRFEEVQLDEEGWAADAIRALLKSRSRSVIEITPPAAGPREKVTEAQKQM